MRVVKTKRANITDHFSPLSTFGRFKITILTVATTNIYLALSVTKHFYILSADLHRSPMRQEDIIIINVTHK